MLTINTLLLWDGYHFSLNGMSRITWIDPSILLLIMALDVLDVHGDEFTCLAILLDLLTLFTFLVGGW
jgi:hypothetical protein